jgi:putative tryptophan/tyrosine transport system substrate-binding protein
VVYVYSGDPVSAGFADSLARPRANMTGLTFMAAEFNGKRLEILREVIGGLRRFAIVANPAHPSEHLERAYTEEFGRQLGLRTDYFATPTRDDLERAFSAMAKNPPQAISLFADGFAIQYRQNIVDFGLNLRVPVVSGWPVFARAGALFTYGPHLASSYQRLANYVDRIFKGARTSDLPIEQPTRFEFVVNLRIAWHRHTHLDFAARRRGDRMSNCHLAARGSLIDLGAYRNPIEMIIASIRAFD